jgi:ATP-dependent DNA ligase
MVALGWIMINADSCVPPGFVAPALPKPAESPPEGDAWLHEIKHDGYRTMLVIDRGTVHMSPVS